MKRFLSILLTAILLAGVIAVPGVTASAAEIKTGTLVTFGSYPQSLVTDQALLDKLNSHALNWTYYDYYANGAREDYMKYADVTYSGARYRAVTFTHYRPYNWEKTSDADNAFQDNNGYEPDTVYWFRYEPVVWRVLDAKAGLMMTEYLIDSQPFHNVYYQKKDNSDSNRYADEDCNHLVSNWAYSSLRSWMNNDFYNTAFGSEKALIKETELTTPAFTDAKYDADPTTDKVFALTYSDMKNEAYGFGPDNKTDAARTAFGSDYAKCQGLSCFTAADVVYKGASNWNLRTPYNGRYNSHVDYTGHAFPYLWDFTNNTYFGVRPALNADIQAAVSQSLIKSADSVVLGDIDGNGQILADDARVALRASAQLEKLSAEQMAAADVDGNGQVLADDARQILRFSAKLQKEFIKS